MTAIPAHPEAPTGQLLRLTDAQRSAIAAMIRGYGADLRSLHHPDRRVLASLVPAGLATEPRPGFFLPTDAGRAVCPDVRPDRCLLG